MTEVSWYVDGLKTSKSPDYDKVEKIMESYYKVNTENVNVAITFGSSSTRLTDGTDDTESRHRLGTAKFFYDVDIEHTGIEWTRVIINYFGTNAVKQWETCLIHALGDILAQQYLKRISEDRYNTLIECLDRENDKNDNGEFEKKHREEIETYLLIQKAFGAYLSIKLMCDYNIAKVREQYQFNLEGVNKLKRYSPMYSTNKEFRDELFEKLIMLIGSYTFDYENKPKMSKSDTEFFEDLGALKLMKSFKTRFDKLADGKVLTKNDYTRMSNILIDMRNNFTIPKITNTVTKPLADEVSSKLEAMGKEKLNKQMDSLTQQGKINLAMSSKSIMTATLVDAMLKNKDK